MAGVDESYDIDLAANIELPPLGKCVDVFGDGSLWAVSASGHSKGHVMYFVNGTEDHILVMGDACNTQYQFDSGIGPGSLSANVEQAQEAWIASWSSKNAIPKLDWSMGTTCQSAEVRPVGFVPRAQMAPCRWRYALDRAGIRAARLAC